MISVKQMFMWVFPQKKWKNDGMEFDFLCAVSDGRMQQYR